jgi:hypothetical protein
MNKLILLQKIPFYEDLDCLELAIQGNCKKFISLTCVQNLITEIWNGEVNVKGGFKGSLKVIY